MALDTCAADGLCATTCPVSIDTGKLVKRFRALRNSSFAKTCRQVHGRLTLRWSNRLVRLGLTAGAPGRAHHRSERHAGRSPAPCARSSAPTCRCGRPRCLTRPRAASRKPIASPRRPCTSLPAFRAPWAGFPASPSEMSLMQATVALAERAGVPVWIPEDVAGNCCATPYSSKGFEESRDAMLNRSIENFWNWSAEGSAAHHGRHQPLHLRTAATRANTLRRKSAALRPHEDRRQHRFRPRPICFPNSK